MTSSSPTVGLIGGTGWLGRNIGRQALEAGVIAPASLLISSRSEPGTAYSQWPDVRWTADNRELVAHSDMVILSVRPQDFRSMEFEAREKLVISVMAGVSSRTLARRSRSERIIRTMPNAAVEIGSSFTPWFAAEGATSADREFTSRLFASCGTAMQVNSESDLDYLTALSGSGPAFPALLADAMLTHAAARGLDPELARRAVEGVVCEASRLLANRARSPADTVRTFLEYRGTTAAGLTAMLESGFSDAVDAGLTAAADAANKMSSDADRADLGDA